MKKATELMKLVRKVCMAKLQQEGVTASYTKLIYNNDFL